MIAIHKKHHNNDDVIFKALDEVLLAKALINSSAYQSDNHIINEKNYLTQLQRNLEERLVHNNDNISLNNEKFRLSVLQPASLAEQLSPIEKILGSGG